MAKIFINYSTGDEENVAAILDRYLSDRFSPEVFFRASKSIPPGADFQETLLEAVRTSDALLAVIGARWLAAGEDGRRRIDLEDDWRRKEIVEALAHRVRVIPLLVGRIPPLQEADLPPVLAPLAGLQYMKLDNRNLNGNLDDLAAKLVEIIPDLEEKQQSSTPQVVNHAYGDAKIGTQGISYGNTTFHFGGRP